MIYLTQSMLPVEVALVSGIKDAYDWHQAVWKAFPGRDGDKRDFLIRVDQKDCFYRLLIVSSAEPVRPVWVPAGTDAWKTTPIPENYFKHGRYRFQLRVNPTKKVKSFGPDGQAKKNGRRVPLVKREELEGWLRRKAASAGFNVDAASPRILSGGGAHFLKQGTQGVHSSVDFEGVLEVTDSGQFRNAFARGIGSAKAFGFGLLVVAPA